MIVIRCLGDPPAAASKAPSARPCCCRALHWAAPAPLRPAPESASCQHIHRLPHRAAGRIAYGQGRASDQLSLHARWQTGSR